MLRTGAAGVLHRVEEMGEAPSAVSANSTLELFKDESLCRL